MSQRSRFFDSSGGDRTYDSAAFAQVFNAIMDTGIVEGQANEYAVTENSPPAMNVLVDTGKSFILGYFHEVYSAAETLTIDASHATLNRIDRIVIRRDLTNRTAVLAVVKGTNGASPTAPALTQNVSGTYEVPVAQVLVSANAVSITNAKITDEREFGDPFNGDLFSPTLGHDHDGVDSKKVIYSNLASIPSSFTPASHTLASHTGTLDHGTALTGQSDDDHPQYQLVSAKNAQNGYAGLDNDASARVPAERLGTGTPSSSVVLVGDRTWGNVPTHASRHATGGADPITPASINAPSIYNTPATITTGRIYRGTSTPTGASEGDIWIDG